MGSPTDSPSGSPSSPPTPSPSSSPTISPSASPTATPTSSPTSSPSDSPTKTPSSSPTSSPSGSPTVSPAPTFQLPDCYDGPKLINKDSSELEICHYSSDMVQINNMRGMDVDIQINNIWTQNILPSQTQVFIHTNGVDAVRVGGDGFQCLHDDGTDIDVAGYNVIPNIQCYQEDPGNPESPFLAVIDVVVTDPWITAQDVSHPCMPDVPIMQSCSWRLVVPCEGEDLCTPDPTTTPSMSPTGTPTATPSSTPTTTPSGTPTKDPTMHPTPVPTMYPTPVPTVYPTPVPTPYPTPGPTVYPTPVPTVYPTPVPTVYPTPVPTLYPTMPPTTMHPTPVPSPYPIFEEEALTMPPTDELMCRDYGPNPCPDDILLLKHDG